MADSISLQNDGCNLKFEIFLETFLKKIESPSGDLTIEHVLIYNIIIAFTTSFGIP